MRNVLISWAVAALLSAKHTVTVSLVLRFLHGSTTVIGMEKDIIDLSYLTEEERVQIMTVIDADLDLRVQALR